jgi:hypothetical protein
MAGNEVARSCAFNVTMGGWDGWNRCADDTMGEL